MKTFTFIDKTKWPERGPWDNEPDKAQWVDPTTGLDCLMLRAFSNWCGYVGVANGHPAFGKAYEDVRTGEDKWPDVHGGLTFADFCQEGPTRGTIETGDDEARICHTPEPGRPDKIWWLGFDCAHSGDKRPATCDAIYQINRQYPHAHDYEQYRDFDYVRAEVTRLAQQLG